MTISRINIRPDGNPEQTATMTFYTRDVETMNSFRQSLPDALANHPLTMFDGRVGYASIDGTLPSTFLMGALAPHLPEPALSPIGKLVSEAVVRAQAASAGLALTGTSNPQEYAGNEVSTTVASVPGTTERVRS